MPKPIAKPQPSSIKQPEPLDDLEQSLSTLNSDALDSLGGVDVETELERLGQVSPLEGIDTEGKDLETVAEEEMSEVLKTFRAAREKERALVLATTDTEYWFCVCFQSRAQKEAFLKAVAWFEHGDKYLDGTWVAKKMGIPIPSGEARFVGEKPEKRLIKEVGLIPTKLSTKAA